MKQTYIRYTFFVSILFCIFITGAIANETINKLDELANELDPEYQVHNELQATPWIDAKEHAGIVYLLFQSPARLERYDMISQVWKADISLDDTPTAFTVDSTALFISFGRRTSRFDLDGNDETHLRNTNYNVHDLFTVDDFLYIYDGDTFLSVNKTTAVLIDSADYHYAMQGMSVAPSIGMAFARDTGYSPSDIHQIELNQDGTLGNQTDSPYHGDYPYASKTYVFPNQARVADNSGIIYNTNDLTYSNSLAGSFDDLAFYGDLPVVLRNNELIAYSNVFLETGRYSPDNPPAAIFIHEQTVFSFFTSNYCTRLDQIPIDLLSPAIPGKPIDPVGLVYSPDAVAVGQSGIVYLLSRNHLSVFRWSIAQRKYIDTIPLLAAPSYMAYSHSTNRLYLAYPSNTITEIKLDQGIAETPFVNTPQTPCGLSTAAQFVFVCDPSGAWVSHFTFSPEGILISQEEWNYYSQEYVWNQANQKMYFFRDSTSPNDLIWEDIAGDGVIGDSQDSPYHSSAGIQHPIRVAPDGSIVVLGSGRIYDGISLVQVNTLSNDIADAAWKNNSLVTLRPLDDSTEVQKWGTTYGVEKTRLLAGSPVRLFTINQGFLGITDSSGMPTFTILNEELEPEGAFPPNIINVYLLLLLNKEKTR